jgi:hypothetical protein
MWFILHTSPFLLKIARYIRKLNNITERYNMTTDVFNEHIRGTAASWKRFWVNTNDAVKNTRCNYGYSI